VSPQTSRVLFDFRCVLVGVGWWKHKDQEADDTLNGRTKFAENPFPAIGASCAPFDARTFSGEGAFERKREAGYLSDAALPQNI